MRWIFLVLLMLNALYYAWHQQEAPLRVKEVMPLSSYRGSQQGIHLLSESGVGEEGSASQRADSDKCLYLGGDMSQVDVRTIEQRLTSLDIQTQFERRDDSDNVYWLKVSPESRRLMDDSLLGGLVQDFPRLKSKIMSCEGIATTE
ncbi:MAG TPA: hypothetical protein VGC62_01930 [Pseudomonas sp.]|uniref:hypothetical protein n=1 Tax=Pseudomonas sp. TaxID=306 RepID=UPI002EDBB739